MITFALAKELQEAGFRQHGEGGFAYRNEFGTANWGRVNYHYGYYTPTLTDLVDACGEGFSQLLRNYTDVPMGGPGKWLACHSPDRGETDDCAVGDGADQAVARLWLAINQKA